MRYKIIYVFARISTISPGLKCVANKGVPGCNAASGDIINLLNIRFGITPVESKIP